MPKIALDDALLVGGAALATVALVALAGWAVAALTLGTFAVWLSVRMNS